MGVCYAVEVVNPEVFQRVNAAFGQQQEISAALLLGLFGDLGRKPSEAIAAELVMGETPSEVTIKSAYDELITARSVWLDKSFNQGLDVVLKTVPDLSVLKHMFLEFGRFDFAPPPSVPTLDFGIFGLWRTESLVEAQKALHLFRQRSDIASFQTAAQFSFIDRMVGRPAKLSTALEKLGGDDAWHHWRALSEVVDEAVLKRWYLGYALR